jgi:hypothetical protein
VAVVGGAMDQQSRPIGLIIDDFAGHGGVTASS